MPLAKRSGFSRSSQSYSVVLLRGGNSVGVVDLKSNEIALMPRSFSGTRTSI
jgi:hypothetical protein